MIFISHSENQTKKIGKKIAAKLKGGEVLALKGDLGAGKTILAKGIAEGLGYKKIVNSPTFVLMKIYKVKFQISNPFGKLRTSFKFQKNNKYQKLNIKTENRIIKNICHIDAYRISAAEEIEAIGALEYFGRPDAVSIVEWPEKIKKILPRNTIWVELGYGKKEEERMITLDKK
ncbi:MAG: tRNA (adenosine(37)-N6)-threonylcarbamoyltransferase complex ATPase subunit type 1 TsaE [bacterium]